MGKDLVQERYSRMNVLEQFQILIMIIIISQFELFSEKSFFLPTITKSDHINHLLKVLHCFIRGVW